jgi:signal transduction histidine kinase
MEALMRRVPRIDPRVFDAFVAVLLFVVVALSFGEAAGAGQRPMDAWGWVLGALLTLPYAVHRRLPWVALAVVLGALVTFALLQYAPYPGVGVFALLAGITLHGQRRDSLVALGATSVAFAVAVVAQPPGVIQPNDVIATFLATAVAWLAADNIRQRRLRWAAMEERTRLLEREREDQARAAVSEERLRIARELHDIVAHSMSVIAVQAGVGKHVIEADVPTAREALGVIEATSRDALVEMRRMLGVLRDGGEVAEVRPTAALMDLPGLVAETRRAGLGVTLDLPRGADALDGLPAGVSLAAYRVVQEALTNVLKHGGPVAHVEVDGDGTQLTIDVTDDGRPEAGGRVVPAPSGTGHGLIGMRERVLLTGGTFSAGERPGGGFRVHATLPYAAGLP